jgi:hypothetical protein
VTADSDFVTKWKGHCLLNPLLSRELKESGVVEVHCFHDLLSGLQHFGANAGVKAEKLPTEEEATEIKKEIEQRSTALAVFEECFQPHFAFLVFRLDLALLVTGSHIG